jgi:hypothetical protein
VIVEVGLVVGSHHIHLHIAEEEEEEPGEDLAADY